MGTQVSAVHMGFTAPPLARLVVLTTVVLDRAGFDPLHATLGTGTIFDYVWGYVIEEQAGEGPVVEPGNLTEGKEVASPFGFDLHGLDMGAIA